MCPEILLTMAGPTNKGKTLSPYGPSVDVYSFGIVMWEIAAQMTVPHCHPNSCCAVSRYDRGFYSHSDAMHDISSC